MLWPLKYGAAFFGQPSFVLNQSMFVLFAVDCFSDGHCSLQINASLGTILDLVNCLE